MRSTDTHTALVGAVCGGRVRRQILSELYRYGVVCLPTNTQFTGKLVHFCATKIRKVNINWKSLFQSINTVKNLLVFSIVFRNIMVDCGKEPSGYAAHFRINMYMYVFLLSEDIWRTWEERPYQFRHD